MPTMDHASKWPNIQRTLVEYDEQKFKVSSLKSRRADFSQKCDRNIFKWFKKRGGGVTLEIELQSHVKALKDL